MADDRCRCRCAGVKVDGADWPYRIVGSPWPEREGLRCRIVPQLDPTYPWVGLGDSEVVVLVEDDPHADDLCFGIPRDPRWSCVLDRSNLTDPERTSDAQVPEEAHRDRSDPVVPQRRPPRRRTR